MTTEQKIIKTKVGVLELAKQLGNVFRACQEGRSQRGWESLFQRHMRQPKLVTRAEECNGRVCGGGCKTTCNWQSDSASGRCKGSDKDSRPLLSDPQTSESRNSVRVLF
jgi:hypothetical protein